MDTGKAKVLLIAQLVTMAVSAPVYAQHSATATQQQGQWKNVRSAMASYSRLMAGVPVRRGANSTRGVGSSGGVQGNASQSSGQTPNQPYGGLVASPLLGPPQDYSDTYQASIGGELGAATVTTSQGEGYRLTPEEMLLAPQNPAANPASAASGLNSAADGDQTAAPRELGDSGSGKTAQQRPLAASNLRSSANLSAASASGPTIYRSPW